MEGESQFSTRDHGSLTSLQSLGSHYQSLDLFTINFPVQMKEEVELDDTYAVLKEHLFITNLSFC